MAVEYKGYADTVSNSPAALSYDVQAGPGRIVMVHWHGDGDPGTFSVAQFAGQNLTLLQAISYGSSWTRIWYLPNPPTGIQTLDLQWPNSPWASIAVVQYNKVNPDSPILDFASYAGSLGAGATATLSPATDPNGMVGTGYMSFTDLSAESGQTLLWYRNWSVVRHSEGAYQLPGSVSWKNVSGAAQDTTISAYSFNPLLGAYTQIIWWG